MRLDDALDYLSSKAGADLVKQLKGQLEKSGANFKQVMGPGMSPGFKDAFEGTVAKFLYGSFLTPGQTTAALPAAVAYALAHCADASGKVTVEAAQKVFGKAGAAIVEALSKRTGGLPVPTARRAMKYDHLPTGMPEMVAKSAERPSLEPRMPALGAVSAAMGGPEALAGLKMISVQHLFPTTETLFEELEANGLDPKQTTLLGKNYSADPDVVYGMRANGWTVPDIILQKLLVARDATTNAEVSPLGGYLKRMFEGVDPTTAKKPSFLILDEGGKLLKLLHDHFPEYAPLCVCVEQTDRGIQVIEDMKAHGKDLLCPVVNVARSVTKKELEAPMIGESVVFSTLTELERANVDLSKKPKEATVIGYGAVGKATADALRRRGYTVYVHDIDPAKMEAAKADGCSPMGRDEALSHAHLLFSCTGRTTITPDEFDAKLPNGSVLVNAASGNHELGMDGIEQGAGFLNKDDSHERIDELGFRLSDFGGREVILGDIAGREDNNSRVLRTKSGHERFVLKAGYVINMGADIPPEYIQLTRGMLLGACLQAVKETKPGLVDLSQLVQTTVVDATRASLQAKGLTLEQPKFEVLAPAES